MREFRDVPSFLPAAAALGAFVFILAMTCTPAAAQTQQLRFILGFIPGGWDTPFYVARDRGFYRDAGLEVEITPGTGSADTARLVGAGKAPLGFADAGTMAAAVVQGVPVIMVAVHYQKSPLTIFSLKDRKITRPRDLEGKSLGLASSAAEAMIFPAFARKNGLDASKVTIVNLSIPTRIPALLAGKVDALGGFITIQGDIASKANTGVNVMKFADYGIDMYGSGIIANIDFANRNPKVVERFLQATLRGLRFTLDSPDAALDSTYKALPDRDRNSLREVWRLSAPLMQSEATRRNGLGWMEEATWKSTQDLMVEYGGQPKALELSSLYTNRFLKSGGK